MMMMMKAGKAICLYQFKFGGVVPEKADEGAKSNSLSKRQKVAGVLREKTEKSIQVYGEATAFFRRRMFLRFLNVLVIGI